MSSILFPRAFGPARVLLTATLVLAMSACSAPAPDEQEAAGAQAQQAAADAAAPAPSGASDAPPTGSCDASQTQTLVGQTLTDELTEQAKQDSGAKEVRVLTPDMMTTMEFNGDRLNIDVDDKRVVGAVRCG